MDSYPAILILAVLWLVIGLPLSKLNKASRSKAPKQPPRRGPRAEPKAAPEEQAPGSAWDLYPARPSTLQPSISVTGHDDSIYQGSMNTVTGEGYDPCHEEQLAPLSAAEAVPAAAEPAVPGLQLNWTGSEIVRGIVMSEILNRK